jgi:ABC-type transporter Mla subunit MlaD
MPINKRAYATVIGAFVLGAIAIAVVAILILGGGHFLRRPVTFVMAFDDVSGLSVGAPVLARGVQVGSVIRIALGYGKDRVAVYADFYPDRVEGAPGRLYASRQGTLERVTALIAQGVRAQLQTQSFVTGQLNVALEMRPDSPAVLTKIDPDYPEIPTIPTELALLQDQLKHLLAEFEKLPLKQIVTATLSTVEGVERLVRSPEVTRAINAMTATMQSVEVLTKDVSQKVGPMATSAQLTLDEARAAIGTLSRDLQRLLQNVDGQVGPLATNVGATSDATRVLVTDLQRTVRDLNDQIAPLAVAARGTLDAARATLQKADGALGGVGGVFDESSPFGYELAQMVAELTRAARAVRALSEEIDRQPNILIFGRDTVQR